jgi:hypothetical protein
VRFPRAGSKQARARANIKRTLVANVPRGEGIGSFRAQIFARCTTHLCRFSGSRRFCSRGSARFDLRPRGPRVPGEKLRARVQEFGRCSKVRVPGALTRWPRAM